MLDIFNEPIKAEKEVGQHATLLLPSATHYGGKLSEIIAAYKEENNFCWYTKGDWSAIDLLTSIISYIGACTVHLSSYAFSETPARKIAELVHSKQITQLYCIIDKRIDVRSASALTLIQNCATKLKLVNTHAKVTVLTNENYTVTIIGSANYTTNNRVEVGVVYWSKELATFNINWIKNLLHDTE